MAPTHASEFWVLTRFERVRLSTLELASDIEGDGVMARKRDQSVHGGGVQRRNGWGVRLVFLKTCSSLKELYNTSLKIYFFYKIKKYSPMNTLP